MASSHRLAGCRIILEAIMIERQRFRSATLKNKCGYTAPGGGNPHIICFSEAEKFPAIFSPALTFVPLNYCIRECGMAPLALTLVLYFVSRQRKERFGQAIIEELAFYGHRSFSFARPKDKES